MKGRDTCTMTWVVLRIVSHVTCMSVQSRMFVLVNKNDGITMLRMKQIAGSPTASGARQHTNQPKPIQCLLKT